MDISNRIRELRKSKGLNQFELAESVGISVDTVRRWESNKQVPRADELHNLSHVLGVTVEELLNGPSSENWELRILMKKEGVIDMTSKQSSAVLNISDEAMAITLSAGYELWKDDAKFEELIEQLRRKRAIVLKMRKEEW